VVRAAADGERELMRRLALVLLLTGCKPAITSIDDGRDGAAPASLPRGDGSAYTPPPPGFIPPPNTQPGMAGPPCGTGTCSDFPAQPILDEGTPAGAAGMFGGKPSGPAPCLLEPENGTLFPQKWLRPRIKWTGTSGLHRITIHSEAESRDLVAYTTRSFWVMPKEIWTALSSNVTDRDITVTVRAADGGESAASFSVAPVSVGGSMVFWSVKPDEVGRELAGPMDEYDSELRGFSVGDESTVSVLRARQVKQPSMDEDGTVRPVRCIGCHAATPDEGFVGFIDDWPWNLAVAGVKPDNTGAQLPGLADGGLAALNLPWGGMMSFSKAFWSPGRRLVVLASSLIDYTMPFGGGNTAPGKLTWYNLDAAGPLMAGQQLGEVARLGDTRGAACPAWSHDGTRIIYSSTDNGNLDGALSRGTTDLYGVPFNDGKGGMALPVPGASDPAFEEYYPALSSDDTLIAYSRVPAGEQMYANGNAELAVVKQGEGKALRLLANDPPACSGKASPGINNHWPRWAPAVLESGARRYYFLLFSSNRADIPPVDRKYPDPSGLADGQIHVTQLYVSVVVDGGENGLRSYPAIYLWNQPTETLNMTPIWEKLAIPKVIE
jgi:hypothetical protein